VTAASPAPAAPLNRDAYFPGWFGRILVAGSLLLVLTTRHSSHWEWSPYPFSDSGFCGLMMLVFSCVAAGTLYVWFCFRSVYSPRVRFTVMAGVPLAIGVFLILFRVKEVDGSMTWRFEPRWQPVADRRLGRIESSPARNRADLAAVMPGDFPQFLGPDRSGYLPGPDLARDWTSRPPKLLWKRPIGAGWSAFAAVNGYAVTLEQRGDEEWVACYELATGRPVWGHSVLARHENIVGGIGPRSTPTIHQGKVLALGATGVLRCLDGATGELLWHDDLLIRYGVSQADFEVMVMWGRAASPLVVDDLVIVPAGGPYANYKSLIAYRIDSGQVVWEAGEDQISYASPALVTLAGVPQIVIVSQGRVTAHDPATGRQLWEHPWPGQSNTNASASQPVQIGSDKLLLTKGYGQGGELLAFAAAEGALTKLPSVWLNHRVLQTKFTNVVVHDGHIYALSDGILECVNLATGQRAWKKGRYGHGQILGVGGLLLVQAEEGEVVLVELNPARHVELGRFQALEGKTWNNLCLVGKTLLVRNGEQAAAWELP
jgi:outer membrane protein assembly factor BamB